MLYRDIFGCWAGGGGDVGGGGADGFQNNTLPEDAK